MENKVLLGHGSGGKLTHDLIQNLFYKHFGNDKLMVQGDAALLDNIGKNVLFTTDSFVVDPIFFPGGDIGKLAVCGTVNDIAVSGGKPLYISVAFIIEEGFPLKDLEKIVISMAAEAMNAGVKIVTGDTKVVNKGKCDKIFINTTGIGTAIEGYEAVITGNKIQPGDMVLVNGTLGDHGISVMAARESLHFESEIHSDCASLYYMIKELTDAGCHIKFMRDATRGGLASVLNELVQYRNLGINIDETQIPIREGVRGACEIFGFDPLYVANEGKVVIIVDPKDSDKIISILQNNPLGKDASIIGSVTSENPRKVLMRTTIGGSRIVDMLAGEQLPRIC